MATEHHNTEHPSSTKYVVIALILSVVTAIEVAVVYVEALAAALIPILLLLSVGKFIVVVGYYMHLKFKAIVHSVQFHKSNRFNTREAR